MVERMAELPPSHLADETAWLEQTARLVAEGKWDKINRDNLSEYLTDMAIRDRREVMSRLVVLLVHLLKWEHQVDQRRGSWEATTVVQQFELRQLLESGTLRNHAVDGMEKAYAKALDVAAKETGLALAIFPAVCPYSLDDILGDE